MVPFLRAAGHLSLLPPRRYYTIHTGALTQYAMYMCRRDARGLGSFNPPMPRAKVERPCAKNDDPCGDMLHDDDVCDTKPDCSMNEHDNAGNDDDSHDDDPNRNPRSVDAEGFPKSFLAHSDPPTMLGHSGDVCESIVGSKHARGVEGVERFDGESSDHGSDPIAATAVLDDVDPCNHESDQADRSGTIELRGDSPRARVSGVPIDPKISCPDEAIIRSDVDLNDQDSREGGFEGLDRSGVVEIGQNGSYLEIKFVQKLGREP